MPTTDISQQPTNSKVNQPEERQVQPTFNIVQSTPMPTTGMVPVMMPTTQPVINPMMTSVNGYLPVITPQGPMLMPTTQPPSLQQPVFPHFGTEPNSSLIGGPIIPITSAPIQSVQEQKPKIPKQSTTALRTAFIRSKLSLEHPSTLNGLKAWKLAKPLAEKGKEFDSQTKYADALAYYETALDYFAQALRAPELTDNMKKQLKEEVKAYLTRAEQIKPVVVEFLKQNPTYFGEVDNEDSQRLETCIVCNKRIEGEFVSALGYNYHPQCFVANVNCKLCGKPFTFPKMEFKIYNDQAYHPLCFEGVTGLEKEITYTPTFQHGTIFYKVKLPKKIFNVNDSFMYDITIDNSTNCCINYIETGLLCEETRFSRGFSGEMKGETTKTEMAKKKIMFEGKVMRNGVITKSEMFSIGMVRPSHHNDIMFYRGYKFVVSLKVSGVALGPKEIVFPIYINE
ncbi:MIT domain containing protein [Entamoeba histolytica HM-1:IMSS-B]|nr:MIT domain containing protein [Entamoeba histolytica HM-1:IMSS-B]